MPTANANTGNGFTNAVSYAKQERKVLEEDQRPEVLQMHNVAGNTRDIGKQMREVADERERVQKPVLHIQINFHPDEKLSKDQANKAVDQVLKEVGINKENNQYLVVQHKDKAHDHYHVIANRVGLDGSLVSNERILERLQVACDKVEQQQGLRRTEGRTVFYDPSQEKGFRYATSQEKAQHRASMPRKIVDKNQKTEREKTSIKAEVSRALGDKNINNPEKFKNAMQGKGIDVRFIENKNGISGVSFKKNDISVKGSEIDAKWNTVKNGLDQNAALSEKKEHKSAFDIAKEKREQKSQDTEKNKGFER